MMYYSSLLGLAFHITWPGRYQEVVKRLEKESGAKLKLPDHLKRPGRILEKVAFDPDRAEGQFSGEKICDIVRSMFVATSVKQVTRTALAFLQVGLDLSYGSYVRVLCRRASGVVCACTEQVLTRHRPSRTPRSSSCASRTASCRSRARAAGATS